MINFDWIANIRKQIKNKSWKQDFLDYFKSYILLKKILLVRAS